MGWGGGRKRREGGQGRGIRQSHPWNVGVQPVICLRLWGSLCLSLYLSLPLFLSLPPSLSPPPPLSLSFSLSLSLSLSLSHTHTHTHTHERSRFAGCTHSPGEFSRSSPWLGNKKKGCYCAFRLPSELKLPSGTISLTLRNTVSMTGAAEQGQCSTKIIVHTCVLPAEQYGFRAPPRRLA